MAKVPTYERRVGIESVPMPDTNTGGAEFLGAMRGRFAQLAGQVGQMADRAAIAEGERDGLIKGLDPEFRPERQNTLYGQAFDRAGIRAFLDGSENRLRERMDQLAIQHEGNPDALATALGDLEAETVGALEDRNFPEAHVAFAGLFSRARTTYVREALRVKTEREKAMFLATANETVTTGINAVGREAYNAGLDPEADATIAAEIEATRRTAEAMVDAGVYTPEQARRLVEEAGKTAVFARVKGAFDRAKSPEEKRQFLAEFQQLYKEGGELTQSLSLDEYEKLTNAMQTGVNQAVAARSAAVTQIDRSARSIEERAAEGFSAPAAEIEQLRADAEATGDPAALARVEAAENYRALGEQLVTMSPLEIEVLRRQTVMEMEKSGATPRSMEVLKAIDGVKTKMSQALSSDPYAWGARAGAIPPQPALSLGQADVLRAQLGQRLAARETMRQRYAGVPFFTAAEKETLAYIARQGGTPALAIAQNLVDALGSAATEVIGEIAEDAPVLANAAGRIAGGGSKAAAEDAMAALAQRRLPDFKPVTMTDAQELAARGILGGAYMADSRAENAVRQEARLIFEKRARDMGLSGDLSKDTAALKLYEKALDEAAGATWRNGVKHGGLDEVNSMKIIVPPAAREGEVQDLLWRLDDAALARLPPIGTANGVAITARQMQGARLVSAGNGRWRVALGDPRGQDPRYLTTPAGDFWTLGYEALKAAVPEEVDDVLPAASVPTLPESGAPVDPARMHERFR